MNALKLSIVFALLAFAQVGTAADPLDTWTQRTPLPPGKDLFAIASGNGQIVAVGAGYNQEESPILTSAGGVNWVLQQSRTTNTSLNCIAYGNGQFVAAGGTGSIPGTGTVLTSPDGTNWVEHPSGRQYQLSEIVYGNGQFAGVGWDGQTGANSIVTLTDGTNWALSLSGSQGLGSRESMINFLSIAYGNGRFVAAGGWQDFGSGDSGSTIATATDGVKWVQGQAGTTNVLYGVAYGNGQFVAVGGHIHDWLSSSFLDVGSIIASADGVNWVSRLSGITNGLRKIAYGNGQFVAMGDGGTTLTSTDGVNWTRRPLSPWGLGPNGIAYGNGHFFALVRGQILESGSIISMAMTRSANLGLLSLSLTGPTGPAYTIQTSTDLITWQDFTNITSAQATNVVFDARPAGSAHLFYRAFGP